MISVSVISHLHGSFVERLVKQLIEFEEISDIYITINIPECLYLPKSKKITLLKNDSPRGFGENHNRCFKLVKTPFFCVLNPDIVFHNNPFNLLINKAKNYNSGIIAPAIIDEFGVVQDSARHFPTLTSLFKRRLLGPVIEYEFYLTSCDFCPEWVAGMFMLFNSDYFSCVGGFDTRYFMYCEDIDICIRFWRKNLKIIFIPSIQVVHDARRDSRKKIKFMFWHLSSMMRFQIQRIFTNFPNVVKNLKN